MSEEMLPSSEKDTQLTTLKKMEREIRSGIIKYYETGMLLKEIKDNKLYECRGYKTFAEYCQKTFDFGRAYGYRLIAYYNVWNLLKGDAKDKIPERVIRALSTVKDPAECQQIWDAAKSTVGEKQPTYKTIEDKVKSLRAQRQLTKALFDSSDPNSVFCQTLKCAISKSNLVNDLIEKSNGEFNKLLRSAQEMQKEELLRDDGIKMLKDELLKRQSQELDNLFSEPVSETEQASKVSPMGDNLQATNEQ